MQCLSPTPKVSVIIPVFNAVPYLRQCLDSVCNQTLRDIEIICVDDGSTDASPNILNEYQRKDNRIIILTQENAGAGASRNRGLAIAKGEYLSFLDSDDFFELSFLEKIYLRCKYENADIGVFEYIRYQDSLQKVLYTRFGIRWEHFPSSLPFSPKSCSEYILESFDPTAWNKLFLRDFVIRHNIRFQEIHRTNDLFFTMLSIALADKITLMDEALVYYRTGMQRNCQSTNYKYPLDFYQALIALRTQLIAHDRWEEYSQSFINMALGCCLYNLGTLREYPEFETVYNFLLEEGFERLGISDYGSEYYHDKWAYHQYLEICKTPSFSYLAPPFLRRFKHNMYFLLYRLPQLIHYGFWSLRQKGIGYTINAMREYIR